MLLQEMVWMFLPTDYVYSISTILGPLGQYFKDFRYCALSEQRFGYLWLVFIGNIA